MRNRRSMRIGRRSILNLPCKPIRKPRNDSLARVALVRRPQRVQLVIILDVCIDVRLLERDAPLVHVLPWGAVAGVYGVCVRLEIGPGKGPFLYVEWTCVVERLDIGSCFGGGAVVVCLDGYEGLS